MANNLHWKRTYTQRPKLDLARVLLVHPEIAPRLTLQTILQAGGYTVDVAASAPEALVKLDEAQYDLVLSEAECGSAEGGRKLLAYARVKAYKPATALITGSDTVGRAAGRTHVAIHTENLHILLGKVAELIGIRAIRRYRPLHQAHSA
jgi:response regulator RpfG family c-di-GMP phosphodiesterase